MIPYDFEYYKPAAIDEAVQLYHSLFNQGKNPVYFSGGTEIITFGRLNQLVTGAVIDIKGIPECNILQVEQNQLLIGAAVTFTQLQENNPFPLLSRTISEIADHTARSKISLGGNLCGQIVYREAVLPLLLSESQLVIANQTGTKQLPIQQIFNQQLPLQNGDLLVQTLTEQNYTQWPYFTLKRRRQGKVGYPLITIAGLNKDGQLRVAVSGLCPFPFRDIQLEQSLNNKQLPPEERVDEALTRLPGPILSDTEGSAEYRLFVLKNTLLDLLHVLEGDVYA